MMKNVIRRAALATTSLYIAACAANTSAQMPTKTRILDSDLFERVEVPYVAPSATTEVKTTIKIDQHKAITKIYVPAPEKIKKSAPRISYSVSTATARGIAQEYALSRVGQHQYNCLYKLWMKESGWNYKDLNRSSGAYGIPQALPGSKMASYGDDWRTNPITQVKWGIHYVNGRYGSACEAWAYWLVNRWY